MKTVVISGRGERLRDVLVVTRLQVPPGEEAAVSAAAREALVAMSLRPGYLSGELGKAADDPGLWLLHSRWTGVGAYRRGLSSYDVKLALAPLMGYVVQEPSAYEVVATVHADPAPDHREVAPDG